MELETLREAAGGEEETEIPALPPEPAKSLVSRKAPRPTAPEVKVAPDAGTTPASGLAEASATAAKPDSEAPIAKLVPPPEIKAKVDPKVHKATGETGTSPEPGAKSAEPDRLEIGEAQLCESVVSFGTVKPLPDPKLKPGQTFYLYVELAGVKYEAVEKQFRARIGSKLELLRADAEGGDPIWVVTPPISEDLCRHRRREFFLNCGITLPEGTEPGEYKLRLTVNDLVSNKTATTQVALPIAR